MQKDIGVAINVGSFAVGEGSNYNVVADNANSSTISAEGSTTLNFYVYLIDPLVAITNQTFSVPLTLTQG